MSKKMTSVRAYAIDLKRTFNDINNKNRMMFWLINERLEYNIIKKFN